MVHIEEAVEAHGGTHPTRPSFVPYVVAMLVLLLAVDFLVSRLGANFLWRERTIYLVSYVARMLAFIFATQFLYERAFRGDSRIALVVNGWLGLVTGAILAVGRFGAAPAVWTFLNLIVEPLDSLVYAVLITWLISKFKKVSTITNTI